jgi:hypothetical protein
VRESIDQVDYINYTVKFFFSKRARRMIRIEKNFDGEKFFDQKKKSHPSLSCIPIPTSVSKPHHPSRNIVQ